MKSKYFNKLKTPREAGCGDGGALEGSQVTLLAVAGPMDETTPTHRPQPKVGFWKHLQLVQKPSPKHRALLQIVFKRELERLI